MHGTEILKKMKTGEMFSYYEDISPAKAKSMLELMPRNRKINKTRIKNYALLMKQGQWDENHPQGLIFDKNGKLIDGQHRLHAVVESNKTIKFYCTFNADDNCVANLDNGLSRTIDQTGQIMGLDTDKLSIAIAKCLFIQIGKNVSTRDIDSNHVLAMYQSHQESIDFAKQKKSHPSIVYAPVRAMVARAHYQALNNPEHIAFGRVDKLDRFIEVLDTGFATSDNESPIVALRNSYLNSKVKGATTEKTKLSFAAKTVTAIYKYLSDSNTKVIQEAKAQLFPIPEDGE
jgi:hypothetical protein